jgi:hypothetical protein
MSLLELMLLLVAIAAGGLYYFTKQIVKEQKKELQDSNLRYQEIILLNQKYLEKDRQRVTEIEHLTQLMKEHGEDFRAEVREKQELQSLYDNAKEEIREHLEKIKELNYEVETSYREPSNQPILLQNIDVAIDYKGQITWTTLEISIALLIADNKLFDVFKKLLNSKLLPESIQEQIDFQLDGLMVVIYCQEFDEEGTPVRSLTWYEIILQIINKKQIITDYLNGVIQESNRAMVVHEALSEKPVKEKEVTNA